MKYSLVRFFLLFSLLFLFGCLTNKIEGGKFKKGWYGSKFNSEGKDYHYFYSFQGNGETRIYLYDLFSDQDPYLWSETKGEYKDLGDALEFSETQCRRKDIQGIWGDWTNYEDKTITKKDLFENFSDTSFTFKDSNDVSQEYFWIGGDNYTFPYSLD